MCMRYVDATVTCFRSVIIDNDQIISFNAPFNSIKSTFENNGPSIDNFTLVTQIDFLGTNNPEHIMENPLEQKKKLDFKIRLTKCDKSEEKRLRLDLDDFTIDLSDMYEKGQVDIACFGFLNYTRITNVDHIDLPGGVGKYVVKVLIKYSDESEDEYTIQSMTKLMIM